MEVRIDLVGLVPQLLPGGQDRNEAEPLLRFRLSDFGIDVPALDARPFGADLVFLDRFLCRLGMLR